MSPLIICIHDLLCLFASILLKTLVRVMFGYDKSGSNWISSKMDTVRFGFGLCSGKISRVVIGSVKKWVWFGSGSGCSHSVQFGSGQNGSGLKWVGLFRVWVTLVHIKF